MLLSVLKPMTLGKFTTVHATELFITTTYCRIRVDESQENLTNDVILERQVLRFVREMRCCAALNQIAITGHGYVGFYELVN